MNRLNWFETLCQKASAGEHHIDDVVVRHGIRLATVFEDHNENDSSVIELGGSGFFRYAVVNPTHRTMWVRFDTDARRKAIQLDGSYSVSRVIPAFKRRKRRASHIPYEAWTIATVSEECTEPQETFITELRVEDSEAKLPSTSVIKHKELENNIRIIASHLPRRGSGDKKMPRDYLKAISKTVITLAGPLGAPLQGLLSLYEDDQKEIQNRRLEELLKSTETISKQALQAAFEIREDLNASNNALLEIMVPAIEVMRGLPEKTTAEKFASETQALVQLQDSKIPAEINLIKELVQLFEPDMALFMALLRNSGYPTDKFRNEGSAYTVISNYVASCRGMDPHILCRTFTELSDNKAGSEVLGEVAQVTCEFSDWARSRKRE